MKLTVFFSVLMMAAVASAELKYDREHFEITGMKVRELADDGAATLANVGIGAIDCSHSTVQSTNAKTSSVLDPLNTVEIVIDQIINIGKKIFNIVQAGKPVLNFKTDIATALPQGAACWMDLQNWRIPESRSYEVAFVNGFGSEVVKMSYRVLWLAGGTVEGKGQYIGYATVMPENIQVSWGFSLNADVAVPTVFNMGSKDAPIAGMQVSVGYRVESPLTTIDQSQAFFVDGRGEFKQLQ